MAERAGDTIGPLSLARSGRDALEGLDRLGLQGARLLAMRLRGRLTMADLIEAHARRTPQAEALVFEDKRYSYAQLHAAVNRYARTLAAGGIGAGDVVALLIDNRPETLMLVAALARLGATSAMCNTGQRGGVLAQALASVAPRALVVDSELIDALEGVRGAPAMAGVATIWCVGGRPDDAAPTGARDFLAEAAAQSAGRIEHRPRVDPDATCLYIFTSGTTGLPKASRMSHRRWLRAGLGLGLAGLRLSSSDRVYCPLPLYHNNALTVAWSSVLCAGATLVLARRFSVSRFWPEVRAASATVFCYTGDLVRVQGLRHIAFVDRLGDTFRWKGENVATTQVEAALDAFAGLREAVVYGVQVPHADGRAGMATLVVDGDPHNLDFAALLGHLERELPAYAVPVFLRLCAQADVTDTMKYRKTDLRARGYAPSPREPVYVRRPRGDRYEPLTESLRERIDAGAVAL